MTGTTYDGLVELTVRGRTWRRAHRPPLSLTILEREDDLLAIPTDQSGGARGGDRLHTLVAVGAQGQVEWRAPASALYFPSADGQGVCEVITRLEAGPGSRLAYLPKVAIPCTGARVEQVVEIDVAGDAEFVYWDGWSDGRTGSGERGAFAQVSSHLEFRVGGRRLYQERWTLEGWPGGRAQPDAAGLQNACQWFVGLAVGEWGRQQLQSRVDLWKAAGDAAECGELDEGVWVARALGRRPRG